MYTKAMKNNNQNSGIIVAFKIGRGGQFHNQGYVSYIGEKKISEFTRDLFLKAENHIDLRSQFENQENQEVLNGLLFDYESGDNDAKNKLVEIGYSVGELEYFTETGYAVGLTEAEAEEGVGTINIDGDYDTVYAQYIEDCSEDELALITEQEYLFYDAKSIVASSVMSWIINNTQ